MSVALDSIYTEMADECKRLFQVPDVNISFAEVVRPNDPLTWGTYQWWNKSIVIKKRTNILSMLEVLCHEIVHHIQYRNGELFYVGHSKGKRVSRYKGIDYTLGVDCQYRDSPWEIDARKYQTLMFNHFSVKGSRLLCERLLKIQQGQYQR